MKKLFSALALVLAAMFVFCSCGGTNGVTDVTGTKDDQGDPGAATTEAPVTEAPDQKSDFFKDTGIPENSFGGYTFTVLMTDLNPDAVIVRDYQWTDGGTVLDDALYRRNMEVMDKLDIEIEGIVDYSSGNTGIQKIRKANTSNDNMYDIGIIATYDCGTLSLSNDLRDLNNYGYLDLTRDWWDQNINRDLTVNKHLYFTTGDMSLVATQAMYNMVFNKDMFKERQWEYPYKLVTEGKWTFDAMKDYVLQVSEDLNADDKRDSNDLYGMVYIHSSVIAAVGTAGCRFAQVNSEGNIEISLNNERAEKAVVDFITLTQDREHVYNGQTATGGLSAVQMFSEGHCLFRWVEHIGFPHFRDTELDYGILPLPKQDELQDRYYTPFGGWDAAFVCVPTSSVDEQRTSTIMECLSYVSKDIVTPAYYTKTLVGTYVHDEDSYDMITLEMDNRIFDIGYIYKIGGLMTGVENLSKNYSTNFSSMMKSLEKASVRACNKVNDTLHAEPES